MILERIRFFKEESSEGLVRWGHCTISSHFAREKAEQSPREFFFFLAMREVRLSVVNNRAIMLTYE
jgi:hypothetical protein